jgi:hypothetical protein
MSTRKVNPLITAVNESIKDSKASAQRMHQHVKDLMGQRMLIRAQFSDMLKNLNTDKHHLSVTMSCGAPRINVTLNKLDSFKDEDLTTLLAYLVNNTEAEVTEEAWPQFHNKDYHAVVNGAHVTIRAYVRSDSPTCRRVQVGTQLKEEPVWELHCN